MFTDFFCRIDDFRGKISRIFLDQKFYFSMPEQFPQKLEQNTQYLSLAVFSKSWYPRVPIARAGKG